MTRCYPSRTSGASSRTRPTPSCGPCARSCARCKDGHGGGRMPSARGCAAGCRASGTAPRRWRCKSTRSLFDSAHVIASTLVGSNHRLLHGASLRDAVHRRSGTGAGGSVLDSHPAGRPCGPGGRPLPAAAHHQVRGGRARGAWKRPSWSGWRRASPKR